MKTFLQILYYIGMCAIGAALSLLGGFQVTLKYFLPVFAIISVLWSIATVLLGEIIFKNK